MNRIKVLILQIILQTGVNLLLTLNIITFIVLDYQIDSHISVPFILIEPRDEDRGSRFKQSGSRSEDRGPRFESSGPSSEALEPRGEKLGARFEEPGSRITVRGSIMVVIAR
jgi:hypothetical protein